MNRAERRVISRNGTDERLSLDQTSGAYVASQYDEVGHLPNLGLRSISQMNRDFIHSILLSYINGVE